MTKRFAEIEKDGKAFGFYWPDAERIFDQISSELQEVMDAIANREDRPRIQEEVGDLIGSCMSLCIFLGLDIDETLDQLNTKFSSRIEGLKQVARSKGFESLAGQSVEARLELWKEVKALEKA